jgi:hypothetical protein
MKQFNLQDALAGKPVVTRDGRKVLRLFHVPEAKIYKVVALIAEENLVDEFMESGSYFENNKDPNKSDLFMASEKVQGFINIYPQYETKACGIIRPGLQDRLRIFSSKEAADSLALPTRVAVASFEYEV